MLKYKFLLFIVFNMLENKILKKVLSGNPDTEDWMLGFHFMVRPLDSIEESGSGLIRMDDVLSLVDGGKLYSGNGEKECLDKCIKDMVSTILAQNETYGLVRVFSENPANVNYAIFKTALMIKTAKDALISGNIWGLSFEPSGYPETRVIGSLPYDTKDFKIECGIGGLNWYRSEICPDYNWCENPCKGLGLGPGQKTYTLDFDQELKRLGIKSIVQDTRNDPEEIESIDEMRR
jgi:hypothetical protein